MKKGVYIGSILVTLILAATLLFSCGPAPVPTAPAAPATPTTPAAPATPTTPAKPVKPIVWRFTSFAPPAADLHTVAREFFSELEKRTDGRFKADYYFSATLVPQSNEAYALRTAIAQSTVFATSNYPQDMPLLASQNLPFATKPPRTEMVKVFMEFVKHPAVQAELDRLNVIVISPGNASLNSPLGNKRIASVADLKGVRIATTQVEWSKVFGKYGAVVISLPAPEYYDGMKKGTFDTVLTSPGAYIAYRLFEVSKYHSLIRAPGGHSAFVVNKEAYNALPADIKAVFQEVAKGAPARAAAIHDGADERLAEFMKENNVENIKFPDSEIAGLKKAFQELVWPDYIEKYTKERGLPVQEVLDYLFSLQK